MGSELNNVMSFYIECEISIFPRYYLYLNALQSAIQPLWVTPRHIIGRYATLEAILGEKILN